MNDDNNLKTGTTTVAIVCRDGAVLAADMRATAGNLIVNKETDKLYEVTPNIIVTMAGTVSDAQLLSRYLKAELALMKIRNLHEASVKEAANLLAGFVYGNIRRMSMLPGISHFLMGGKDDNGFHVYDIFADGSLTLVDDYVTSGSGCVFALGVLETMYKKDITVEEGTELAVKAINAALQRDTFTGNGINLVTITKKGIKRTICKLSDAKLKM